MMSTWGKIKEICKVLFWQNKIMAILIYTSLLCNGIVWFGLWRLIQSEQNTFIGHYNVFFGIDVIVNVANQSDLWNLFLVPIGGLFFLILSILMSIYLIFQLDELVAPKEATESFVSNRAVSFVGSRILLIGAWLLQLVLVVYLIAILLINN